tara:strand:- start:4365 stop:4895 length:531 start_codon:yes stop_codon:yes gene_type:complete
MNVGWSYELSDDQRPNPVVHVQQVALPEGIFFPTEQSLLKVFKTNGFKPKAGRLKAWGRSRGDDGKIKYKDDPHWIAVRNGTPLHLDPPYPRYSHHLKVRVDNAFFVRGIDQVELPLRRGTFYVLDTHSPHQVINKGMVDGWNVAVSIDSNSVWDSGKAISCCLEFALSNSFYEAA